MNIVVVSDALFYELLSSEHAHDNDALGGCQRSHAGQGERCQRKHNSHAKYVKQGKTPRTNQATGPVKTQLKEFVGAGDVEPAEVGEVEDDDDGRADAVQIDASTIV